MFEGFVGEDERRCEIESLVGVMPDEDSQGFVVVSRKEKFAREIG